MSCEHAAVSLVWCELRGNEAEHRYDMLLSYFVSRKMVFPLLQKIIFHVICSWKTMKFAIIFLPVVQARIRKI